MGFLSTAAESVERGVGKLSQRAFEGSRRDLPPNEPTRRQLTVKAIAEGHPTEDQIKESLDFGLATQGSHGELELTPIGEFALSRYPKDRREEKAAAA
jgi:hypothetical protein